MSGKMTMSEPSQTPAPISRAAAAVVGFLARYSSKNTVSAFALDLGLLFQWCAARGLDPLEAPRTHLELFARYLEDERESGRLRCTAVCPRSPASIGWQRLTATWTSCWWFGGVGSISRRGPHRRGPGRRGGIQISFRLQWRSLEELPGIAQVRARLGLGAHVRRPRTGRGPSGVSRPRRVRPGGSL